MRTCFKEGIIMGNMSLHFSDYEFKCPCCGEIKVDKSLIYLLEIIREHFQKPVEITSGYRCESNNRKVGGDVDSKHLLGQAADIVINGVNPVDICTYAEKINKYGGLGRYNTFTHLDICFSPASRRWNE